MVKGSNKSKFLKLKVKKLNYVGYPLALLAGNSFIWSWLG